MFQPIVLSVSPDVIMFHHGGGKAWNGALEMNRKNGKYVRVEYTDGTHATEGKRKKYYAEWGASCL